MILSLAGGVGGAKLSNGLASIRLPEDLTIVVNTGDDFAHLGLRISPDLDTVMYTLAGRGNPDTGWGLAAETWNVMDALQCLGGETWFRLGDRDLATHLERTRRIGAGETLSEVTAALCRAFGVRHAVAPMSDQSVRTILHTDEGTLSFQHYFVRRRCEPRVLRIEFLGENPAAPSPAFSAALSNPQLEAIVICPSNPYLSIQPILSLSGIREAMLRSSVPVVAVSPIIGGEAVKGPAAKMIREFGETPRAAAIARFYTGLIDGIIIDERDRNQAGEIEGSGTRVCVTDTLMKSAQDQSRLAREVSEFALGIARGSRKGA